MLTPAEVKAGATNVTTAFKNLQTNSAAIAAILASQAPSPAEQQIAILGWQGPLQAAQADFNTLMDQTNTFTSSMGPVTRATYESARFDPLWNLTGSIVTSPLTYEAAFSTFSSNLAAFTAQYDATLASNGITNDPVQPFLHAYPPLLTAAKASLQFLQHYKNSLAEDVSSGLLWAGKDLSGGDSDMPPVLKDFVRSGHTDYSINATILGQFATPQLS